MDFGANKMPAERTREGAFEGTFQIHLFWY